MKRFLLAGIAAAPMLLTQPSHSYAVIVECANCSDLTTQLWQKAQEAEAYATQLQQKAIQLQQMANMATNTISLPQAIWSNVQADIGTVRNLANAASLLTGNSGTIMSRLQSAQGYAGQASSIPANVGAQFQMWQQTISNANNSLGRTLATQQQQMSTYASQQAAINLQSQTAEGQKQVLQAAVEMASLTSTQLNQIQATLTAAAQEQATRDLIAADRQAAQDADLQNFLAPPPLPVSGNPAYGPNTLQ